MLLLEHRRALFEAMPTPTARAFSASPRLPGRQVVVLRRLAKRPIKYFKTFYADTVLGGSVPR